MSQPFRNKLRVRASGILIENDKILLLEHEGIGKDNILWAPPGGGVQFGETTASAVIREYKEETNLNVQVDRYIYTSEYVSESLHAVEVFFKVHRVSGNLALGTDPEYDSDQQLLKGAHFYTIDELKKISKGSLHHSLTNIESWGSIFEDGGLHSFQEI